MPIPARTGRGETSAAPAGRPSFLLARATQRSPDFRRGLFRNLALSLLILFAASSFGVAQVAADAAVQVSATVSKTPVPTITLAWPANAASTGFTVYRKAYSATTWGTPLASLPGTATGYPDATVSIGVAYEYWVASAGTAFGTGYLAAGIELPLVEARGKVILVVDATFTTTLASELSRLERDLEGDGWTVLRHDVGRTDAVPSVKALIHADYAADPTNVKSVFLFGHVPVPYSGAIAPDGHPDHYGAWPADMYYGDMDGVWTDTFDYTSTVAGRQHNAPGDGKFDQSSAPSSIELQVGRVDLANMPAFAPKTELDLLRQYLNKDHNFRQRLVTAQRRGLIDDNFGYFGGEAFAASGWRTFAAFFGAANVHALDWFTTLATQSYLWAYGCGGGWYQGAGGVGSTSNFAATDTQAIFTMLFGSYFGDWDTQDNFLRAPLATPTYGLTDAWSGRPHWFFHHMGMGETTGYSTKVTQNNSGTYAGGYGPEIHIALMGDPTLRMHVLAPPSALQATPGSTTTLLQWAPSPDPVLGYDVYRLTGPAGPLVRVNGPLVTGTSYTAPSSAGETWAVRAVHLETSGGGTYFNASQAVFADTVPPPASFYTLTPCRLIDTRLPNGPWGGPALAAPGSRTVVAAGQCGIPSDARSIAANVAVIGATAGGHLVIYPAGTSVPLASTLNYRAGRTRANNAILALGGGGDLVVQTAQPSGSVHFLIDVTGYFR